MTSKTKCPICGSRASPHRRGERLRLFSNALRALGFAPATQAHPSCLISILNVRYNTRLRHGLSAPRSNTNPSELLKEIQSQ